MFNSQRRNIICFGIFFASFFNFFISLLQSLLPESCFCISLFILFFTDHFTHVFNHTVCNLTASHCRLIWPDRTVRRTTGTRPTGHSIQSSDSAFFKRCSLDVSLDVRSTFRRAFCDWCHHFEPFNANAALALTPGTQSATIRRSFRATIYRLPQCPGACRSKILTSNT